MDTLREFKGFKSSESYYKHAARMGPRGMPKAITMLSEAEMTVSVANSGRST